MIADDFDGVFVGADGAVTAKAIELAAYGAFGRGVEAGSQGKAGVGYIILNANGKVVLGGGGTHVVVHSLDHGGSKFLGAKAITASDNHDVFTAVLKQYGGHVLIQRLTQTAGLLRAVEHRQAFHGSGQSREEVFGAERTIEVHFEHTALSAFFFEGVDGFLNSLGA